MSDFATLSNTGGSVSFAMDPAWLPEMREVAAVFAPLGNSFYTKSSDGFKGVGGEFTIVSTSASMDSTIIAILNASIANVTTFTLPDGRSYSIMTDPQTPPKATGKFSQWNWAYINVWTIKYLQAA